MKKTILLFTALLALNSCQDIGGALFFAGDGTYEFTNDNLETGYLVNETKIHRFETYSENDTIQGVYVGDFSQIENDTIIVYLHGNAPSMDNFWSTIGVLANLNEQHHYGVLMYDYRGYGKSTGTTLDAATMQADYNSVLNWLKDRGLTSDRMVVFANSLGSLPAGAAAAGNSPITVEKLVMEVPQSSADAILQGATGLSLPSSMITSYNFDLGSDMANYPGDLLWMHGTSDDVAPIDNARAAMAEHQGTFYSEAVYEGAGHGLRWDIGNEEWSRVLLDFMRE